MHHHEGFSICSYQGSGMHTITNLICKKGHRQGFILCSYQEADPFDMWHFSWTVLKVVCGRLSFISCLLLLHSGLLWRWSEQVWALWSPYVPYMLGMTVLNKCFMCGFLWDMLHERTYFSSNCMLWIFFLLGKDLSY